jgi:hypothetical protein
MEWRQAGNKGQEAIRTPDKAVSTPLPWDKVSTFVHFYLLPSMCVFGPSTLQLLRLVPQQARRCKNEVLLFRIHASYSILYLISGSGTASRVQLRSYLEEKVAAPV